jgi:hypothetical protein
MNASGAGPSPGGLGREAAGLGREAAGGEVVETEVVSSEVVKAANDRRWVIITLLMIGVGPLALPALWRSRVMGRTEKVLWTIACCVQTALVLGILAVVLVWFVGAMREAFG